jgi:enoyl-CoA hydratase
MPYATLDVEYLRHLVMVKLNRPEKLNAISTEMHREIQQLCSYLREDAEARVVILTGAGRAFSAGADISEVLTSLRQMDPVAARLRGQIGSRTSAAIEDLPQVTIAAVNGLCVGGAVVFALCCDLRLAAKSAWFWIREVELGMPWTWNSIPRLMREVGPTRTLELVAPAKRFTSQQAFEWGMLNYVVPDDDLMQAADSLAEKLISNPALPVALTKASIRALKRGSEMGQANYSDAEILALAEAARQYDVDRNIPK